MNLLKPCDASCFAFSDPLDFSLQYDMSIGHNLLPRDRFLDLKPPLNGGIRDGVESAVNTIYPSSIGRTSNANVALLGLKC